MLEAFLRSHPFYRGGRVLGELSRRPAIGCRVNGVGRVLRSYWPHGVGSAAGMPKVPSTPSTKFLSSRGMIRFACAIARFSRPAQSAFRRVRYASYEVRLSKAINPHATPFVPS